MKWLGGRQSSNVDDRRGLSTGGLVAGGGVIGVIIYLINIFLGGDPSQIPPPSPGGQSSTEQMTPAEKTADDERADFTKVVLGYTEDVWKQLFQQMDKTYREPVLVLFNDRVESACGLASAVSGPFYCPDDQKLYIDLSFFRELQTRFKAPGDFAMAYVVAHEVGHHIQKLLGTMDRMSNLQGGGNEEKRNRYSVMLELQADFYAGVWAHHAQQMKEILDAGDIEEALRAANAIGDDRLQKEGQGYIVPESFTHGTSQQRMYWFKRGFETGDIKKGDTFNDQSLQ